MRRIPCMTTETIAGHQVVQTLGLVQGSTVRTRHLGVDVLAVLRTLVGGEVGGYSRMMAQARDEAQSRMMEEAAGMGADAVVSVRFATSMVMGRAAEILCYGTAVRLTRLP